MATKWKYADIDAENRLEMLRNGNKELFLEETARTKEITDARRALGLDTSEQEKWMDTVGRNYNQSLASEGDTVSTKGYAELYTPAFSFSITFRLNSGHTCQNFSRISCGVSGRKVTIPYALMW